MQDFKFLKEIAESVLSVCGLFFAVRYNNSKENRLKTEAEARKLNAEAKLLELEYEIKKKALEQ